MNKEPTIIEGEVTAEYRPVKNDSGKWRPANIYISTDKGKVKISSFPDSDFDTHVTYEPIQMPEWYTSLDLDSLVGATVRVIAYYKSTYEGTLEYTKVQLFEVADSLPKPAAAQGAPTQQEAEPAPWSNASQAQKIAWGQSNNLAANFINNQGPWQGSDQAYLKRLYELACMFYPVVLVGPGAVIDFFHDTPPELEPEPEQSDEQLKEDLFGPSGVLTID